MPKYSHNAFANSDFLKICLYTYNFRQAAVNRC